MLRSTLMTNSRESPSGVGASTTTVATSDLSLEALLAVLISESQVTGAKPSNLEHAHSLVAQLDAVSFLLALLEETTELVSVAKVLRVAHCHLPIGVPGRAASEALSLHSGDSWKEKSEDGLKLHFGPQKEGCENLRKVCS
jgi:hypothetical protein